MSKGGMQSSAAQKLYCKCNKCTSKIITVDGKEISIHFSRNGAYWHIWDGNKITTTFKKPKEWE